MLEWLENWLNHYCGAALIVSHDRVFLDRTVSRILDLNPRTHTIKSYKWNYTKYTESITREYQKQLPSPIEGKDKFILYLFKDRPQWEMFSEKFTGDQWPVYQKIKNGAYYLKGACVATTTN